MKIDMHCHCSERSSCSVVSEKDLIETAIAQGLDGLVITDHNTMMSQEHLEALNQQYAPFRIFSGVEITDEETGEDILVIGIAQPLWPGMQWVYADLHAFCRQQGGAMILAHPYRYDPSVLSPVSTLPPDGIEVHSSNIGKCDEALIQQLAQENNCRLFANSDAHSADTVGIYYNDFTDPIATDAQLADAIRQGAYSIGGDTARIAAYNQRIQKSEALIHTMLDQGQTAEDFVKRTGQWEGRFHRVASGRSYQI